MAELEKVIKGLERCSKTDKANCEKCPYNHGEWFGQCTANLCSDALELLKEQYKTRLEIAHEIVSGSVLMYQGKELVLCKDCKYYHKPEFGFTFGDCTYASAWYQTNTDDYCSKGKRRET